MRLDRTDARELNRGAITIREMTEESVPETKTFHFTWMWGVFIG